jgi:hypothetical protein
MRARRSLLASPLLLLLVPAFAQDWGRTQEESPLSPVAIPSSPQQEQLEEQLVGVWTLVGYDFVGRSLDEQRLQGFAVFLDGFMSITLQAQAAEPTRIFGGSDIGYYFQAGVHRYRVSEMMRLQTASILGFDNMNDDAQLDFIGATSVREHQLTLQGDLLTLFNEDGSRLVFRKTHKSAFPVYAIEHLRRNVGGEPIDEDDELPGRAR